MSGAPAQSRSLRVNGEEVDAAGLSLGGLIEARGIDRSRRGLAVARNGEVVERAQWDAVILCPEDRVEILQPLAGG